MTEPEDAFASLLSTFSAVQTFLGVTTAVAAAAKIHVDEIPWPTDTDVGYTAAELIALRPYILVSRGDIRGELKSVTVFDESSRLYMLMEQNAPAGYAASKAATASAGATFKASCRAVLDAIKADETFRFVSYEIMNRGWAAPEVQIDEGVWQACEMAFTPET